MDQSAANQQHRDQQQQPLLGMAAMTAAAEAHAASLALFLPPITPTTTAANAPSLASTSSSHVANGSASGSGGATSPGSVGDNSSHCSTPLDASPAALHNITGSSRAGTSSALLWPSLFSSHQKGLFSALTIPATTSAVGNVTVAPAAGGVGSRQEHQYPQAANAPVSDCTIGAAKKNGRKRAVDGKHRHCQVSLATSCYRSLCRIVNWGGFRCDVRQSTRSSPLQVGHNVDRNGRADSIGGKQAGSITSKNTCCSTWDGYR